MRFLHGRRVLEWSLLVVATSAAASCSFFGLFESAKGPRVLWHVIDSGVSTPAFDSPSGTAYFLASDHRVVAIASDGKKRWEGRTFDGSGTTLGLGGCGIAAALVICNDSGLVALRRSDGVRVWQFIPTVGRDPGYAGFVVSGDAVYAGSPTGHLFAVDAVTGAQRWVQRPPTVGSAIVNVTGISTDGQIVFAAYTKFLSPSQGGVMAVDVSSGQAIWTVDFPRPAADSLTGAVSTVVWSDLVLASSNDGRIYALSRATGSIQWSLPGVGRGGVYGAQGPYGADIRALSVQGNKLYAGSQSAWLIAYDLPTRKEIWRVSFGGSDETFPPLITNDLIYDTTAGGGLSAVTSDGRLYWSAKVRETDRFIGAPTEGPDRIFLSGKAGFWAIAR